MYSWCGNKHVDQCILGVAINMIVVNVSDCGQGMTGSFLLPLHVTLFFSTSLGLVWKHHSWCGNKHVECHSWCGNKHVECHSCLNLKSTNPTKIGLLMAFLVWQSKSGWVNTAYIFIKIMLSVILGVAINMLNVFLVLQ